MSKLCVQGQIFFLAFFCHVRHTNFLKQQNRALVYTIEQKFQFPYVIADKRLLIILDLSFEKRFTLPSICLTVFMQQLRMWMNITYKADLLCPPCFNWHKKKKGVNFKTKNALHYVTLRITLRYMTYYITLQLTVLCISPLSSSEPSRFSSFLRAGDKGGVGTRFFAGNKTRGKMKRP